MPRIPIYLPVPLALCAVWVSVLGCDALPDTHSDAAARAPAPGQMILEQTEDGLILLSNGARRREVIAALAELWNFEVVEGGRMKEPVRIHAIDVSLEEALDLALGDTPYLLESDVDPFDGHRRLTRVIVAPDNADAEPRGAENRADAASGVEREVLLRELRTTPAAERAEALWMLDPDHPDERTFLLEQLGDGDGVVRAAAAVELGLSSSPDVEEALRAALLDEDQRVVEAAKISLERIRTRP